MIESNIIIILEWGLFLNFISFLWNIIIFFKLLKTPIGHRLKLKDFLVFYEKGYIPYYTFINHSYLNQEVKKWLVYNPGKDVINYLHYLRLNKNKL